MTPETEAVARYHRDDDSGYRQHKQGWDGPCSRSDPGQTSLQENGSGEVLERGRRRPRRDITETTTTTNNEGRGPYSRSGPGECRTSRAGSTRSGRRRARPNS